MRSYEEIEAARVWDEYKAEQADWSNDIGGEFGPVFEDED